MAIPSTTQRVGLGSNTVVTGAMRPVIQSVGATRTLTPEESGSLCLMDRAAGVVYTLPPAAEGLEYIFQTTVTITSNAAKVITNSTSEFLVGAVLSNNSGATTATAYPANGTTIRALSSNGTTTGGTIGDCYRVRAISATQWAIEGYVVATGTTATPFATS